MISQTRHRGISSGALLLADDVGTSRMPTECGPTGTCAAAPIPLSSAVRGPWPLSALAIQHPHPIVVGLLRPDLRATRNRAAAQAAVDAEEMKIRAIALQHQWRMAAVLSTAGLQPETDTITDPIERLLNQVHHYRANTVVVPHHQYLTDLQGHDCREAVGRACAVATTSPEQFWPCPAGATAVPPRALP
ncbi:hypothetical protein ACIBG0_36945 [Nocardia sp. NPDC050630]|uniref:hypothetical protein n=1 Tax=Nocardia sp. NPDC050630 TaxID=3364321 RepID=UPI0037A2E8F2